MNRKRRQRTGFPFWSYVAVVFVITYCTAVAVQLRYLPEINTTTWDNLESLLSQPNHRKKAQTLSRPVPKPITAYLEPKMKVTIPGSATRGDPDKEYDKGKPPKYKEPLPLRLFSPADLRKVEYATIQSCHDVPSRLPVGRPLTNDNVWNIGDDPLPENYTEIELPFCPVETDPYLPWIHDLFLDLDEEQVRFVAQNRRRCRTGTGYGEVLEHMEPQVALLQHVSVEIITEKEARTLAPEVWQSSTKAEEPRYRLSDFRNASATGRYTRFICKFHTSSSDERRIELGETLSVYPFHYEFAAFRKSQNDVGLLSSKGKDNSKFWTSTLLFSCPLSEEAKMLTKTTDLGVDPRPLFHVDIIPIRAPPRFAKTTETNGGHYLPEELVGSRYKGSFDPLVAWGKNHVLPPVEASGRWENLPVCPVKSTVQPSSLSKATATKPHLLSACLWASAIYHTRGKDKESLSDTKDRLMEWIEFHLMVGFDHIYVYDNSANPVNNLKPITGMFSSKEVTWIDWPHAVCNNNIPAHDNTGERSSQYAAENSCRTRYAPLTEWIASFDTDEYLVPMGNHRSLRSVVEQDTETNILSFRSSRGKLRYGASEQLKAGREKLGNVTFLEAYNCDGSESPRPEWADRARKQLYRADYVPYHFVHYSTITQGLLDTPRGESNWIRFYEERPPSERITDELNEATMIHAKTITRGHTAGWKKRCRYDFKRKWLGCYVGLGWPNNTKSETSTYDPITELDYNCFMNPNVENYWIPRLNEALKVRKR